MFGRAGITLYLHFAWLAYTVLPRAANFRSPGVFFGIGWACFELEVGSCVVGSWEAEFSFVLLFSRIKFSMQFSTFPKFDCIHYVAFIYPLCDFD